MGNSEFVETVLSHANEKMERRYRLHAEGINFQTVIKRVASLTGIEPDEILSGDRDRRTVAARSLLCYWATEELGLKQPEIAHKLGVTQAAVSLAIKRGRIFAAENKVHLR